MATQRGLLIQSHVRTAASALATVICLGALFAGPGSATAANTIGHYRQLERAINDWRVAEGESAVAYLERNHPDDPMTHLAQARYAFYTGAYAEAVDAVEQIEDATGPMASYQGFFELVRTTHENTRNMHATRSEHFEVYTDRGSDKMLAPFVLETLERALTRIGRDLDTELQEGTFPIRVEVYPSVREFVEVSTLTADEVGTSGTVALAKFNRLMIVSPRRMARGYRWRDTLSHELVHFLLSWQTRNQLPLWLHEGIAKFEERRWYQNEIGRLHPIQESILAEARDREVFVPFSDMMPSLAKLGSGWKTSLGFAEVTLLVSQIVAEGSMVRLREVVNACAKSDDAGYAALGVADEHELWQQFRAKLAEVDLDPVPGYEFIPPTVAQDPDKAEPEPITKAAARKHSRIGDLLRQEGRWSAAVTQYSKAEEELGYRPAPLSLKRAEAWMIGGLYTQAKEELLDLVRRDPDRATTHYLLGKIALFEQDPETALARFERAFAITPFHENVLEGLITASEQLGDNERQTTYQTALETWHEHRGR